MALLDLEPDADQLLLMRSVRAFLEARVPLSMPAPDPDESAAHRGLWQEIATLGWLDAATPAATVALLFEELGRGLFPLPVIAVAVAAARALQDCGSGAASNLCDDIASGSARPVLAVPDADGAWSQASPSCLWSAGHLSGSKHFVEAAPWATAFLVTAVDTGGSPVIVQVAASQPSVEVHPQRSMAGVTWGEVRFHHATASLLAASWHPIDVALTHTAAMHGAWCAGAARRMIEETVAYVVERRQFGVPIGSFQSVHHRLADCDLAASAAQTLSRQAAALLETNSPQARRLASTAFLVATEAFVKVARTCHQLWGGMGYSLDTPMHLFSRRAKVAQHSWGGAPVHLAIVEDELLHLALLCERYASETVSGRRS